MEASILDDGVRLAASALHEVVRGIDAASGTAVVVKRVRLSHDPVPAREQIDRERRILRTLAGVEGVPSLRDGGPNEVVVVDLGGQDLRAVGLAGAVDLRAFLVIAERLARTLAAIHEREVLHLDLHPGNVVLRRSDLAVQIIDFASSLPHHRPLAVGPDERIRPGGRPAYLAPELAVGSMSAVDDRADLYALGAVLAYLATGQPPFPEEDPVALRHAQRTGPPVALDAVAPWLPASVAAVMTRLLQPDPEDRYRSAEGLAHDLGQLRELLVRGEDVGRLRLGARDVARTPRLPRDLVGRERELTALHDALAEVRDGGSHAVFVAGPSGVGKTVLVDALRAHVAASGGRFVSGKFDELRRDRPFSAPADGLRELAGMLAAGAPGQVRAWRQRLTEVLGTDAAVVADAVPGLRDLLEVDRAHVIGDPLELRARLRASLGDLLRVVAHRDEPLVLFLDDLQWADQPSLDLLIDLLADAAIDGLLVLGTYRSDEVGPRHPLTARLRHLDAIAASVRHVTLHPLGRPELEELVASVLPQPGAVDPMLLDAVAQRTGGNPYHAIELLLHLHGCGVVAPDRARGRWRVAADRLELERIGEDLLPMLVDELEALADPHGVLATAACLGGSFTIGRLAHVVGLPLHDVEVALTAARRRGVLQADERGPGTEQPGERVLAFAHDRMHEAARELLQPEVRRARHLELARRLGIVDEDPIDVLAAAEQLLLAAPVQLPAVEAGRAAQVLRAAGRRACASGAFPTAVRFLELAVSLLPPDAWTDDRHATFGLHAELHAALQGAADHARADEVFAVLAEHARDTTELAAPARLHITGLADRTRYEEAVRLGVELLAQLGVAVPVEDPLPDLHRGLAALEAAFAAGTDDVLPTTPAASGERAVAWLINRTIPAAFFWRPELAFWLSVTSVERWLTRGYLDEYLYPAACLSLATIGLQDDPALGYRVAREALRVGGERVDHAPTEVARTHHVVGLFVAHWFEPLERSIDHARLAFDQLARAGETDFACFSFFTTQAALLDTAGTLTSVAQEVATAEEYAARTGNEHAQHAYVSFQRLLAALRGETDAPGSFEGAGFRESSHLDLVTANPMARGFFHTYRAVAAAIFDDRAALHEHAASATAHTPYLTGFWPTVLVRLVAALAASDRLQGDLAAETAPRRAEVRAQLVAAQSWLLARATDSPDNVAHLASLVTAERAAVEQEHWAAHLAYERAIEEAARHHRPWHLALILERAARFHLRHGLERSGGDLLLRARRTWHQLGATGKVAQLDQQSPHLEDLEAERSSGPGADVDHLALLRAVRAISGERTRPGLVAEVVDVVGQLAGATAVLLAMRDTDDTWWLEGGTDGDGRVGRQRLEVAAVEALVPAGLLRHVLTSGDLLVSPDASTDPRFAGDPRYADRGRCSLVLLPIRHRGALEAVLVLENRSGRGAFGSARLELLTLLASQLGTALESLRVHERLEQTVAVRTRELEQANQQLDRLSRTDGLTGIANRRHFDEALALEWRRARRHGVAIGLILLDIDRFKAFNDRYGHQTGDAGLQAVAAVLRACCRRASEIVARFGGEEFAVIVAHPSVDAIQQLAEELRAGVSQLTIPTTQGLTISVGVAVQDATRPRASEQTLLRAADQALYRAKERGRDRVALWTDTTPASG